MAGTVNWSLLRELAGFRAEKGCAISLHVNLDPSEVPTASDAHARMNALLTAAEKADRTDLSHEQRGALQRDFDRIARWFDDDFDRNGARGLVVFAAALDNYWFTLRADRLGPRHGQGRTRVLRCAAHPTGRAGGRDHCRGRRTRARTAVPTARGTARRDRGAFRRAARAARPGRLVAVALPPAHREARPGAPEGSGRTARPQPAEDALAEDRPRVRRRDALGVHGRAVEGGAGRGRRLDAGRVERVAERSCSMLSPRSSIRR